MQLTPEDIAFLADLRNELLTQPTDGNRDPRFWTVNQRYRIECLQRDYASGWRVLDTDGDYRTVGNESDKAAVIAELCDAENGYELGTPEDYADCYDIEDVVNMANEQMGESQFIVVYFRDEYRPCPDTLFLTKRACQAHIDRYGYNYTDPHTYVMTAVRSPEYACLLGILKRVDWASLPGANMGAEEPRQ